MTFGALAGGQAIGWAFSDSFHPLARHHPPWYHAGMKKGPRKKPTKPKTQLDPKPEKEPREKTPTFLVELPLHVNAGQAKRIRAHLEAGRQLYNAVLSQGHRRLKQMRDSKAWQQQFFYPPD